MERKTINSDIERYKCLTRFFQPSKRVFNPYFKNLFNPYSYYDMLREDVDGCCEIAIRYDLVVNDEKGLLKGGRNIYSDSTLYELRVARLFERYFGKGCLCWDPAGSAGSVGEFKLSIENKKGKKCSIFVEVKTIEKRELTEYGTLRSKENSIDNTLRKAYTKIKNGIDIPFLVVLCHDHFSIHIDAFQIIRACFGRIAFPEGSPEVISRGFVSPDIHTKLSAVGLYYFYIDAENHEFKEYFGIFHNDNANIQIDNCIFENKANKQFCISEWNGEFD
jgi:hypothetical protein